MTDLLVDQVLDQCSDETASSCAVAVSAADRAALKSLCRRDATIVSVLRGAQSALFTTHDVREFADTLAMLVSDAAVDAVPSFVDAALVAEARAFDAELTDAALRVFDATGDADDLLDTLLRICVVHDSAGAQLKRQLAREQAMLDRGDLSFLCLSDAELSARIAASAQSRAARRSAFASWSAGALNAINPFPIDAPAAASHAPSAVAPPPPPPPDIVTKLRSLSEQPYTELAALYASEPGTYHHGQHHLSFEEQRFLVKAPAPKKETKDSAILAKLRALGEQPAHELAALYASEPGTFHHDQHVLSFEERRFMVKSGARR